MYEELYEIWKQETTNSRLASVPPDFYSKIVEYLRKLSEESRMLDRKTAKAALLRKELKNVKRMVRDIIFTRYKKLLRKTVEGENIQSNFLTPEERRIFSDVISLEETLPIFLDEILSGKSMSMKLAIKQKRRRTAFRFMKDVPAIVGIDMKTYGPFKVEDVGSLPLENAKILIKQNVARKIHIE